MSVRPYTYEAKTTCSTLGHTLLPKSWDTNTGSIPAYRAQLRRCLTPDSSYQD